jgi:predicted Zn finger-like uncharacterized protein
MYLTCPNCETVYAMRAAMLRDGQGEVRCGTCRLIFNALDCLSDELPTTSVSAQPPVPSRTAALTQAEPAGNERKADAAAQSLANPSLSSAFTQALRDDFESLQQPSAPVGWQTGLWFAAMLGLLTLGFQYLWFAPQDLSRRFPQVATQVESFCLSAGCMTRADRAPHLIRVLSRDVRAHPRYEGALLVTGTFSNAATWAQPFPGLRFSLYDVNGRTIAARTFTPAQYLAGVLPADASLPAGQPVQVALEMLAPDEAAVSFEFTFL